LAISTQLFGDGQIEAGTDVATSKVDYPHPFRNCIVLGLMLAEWWESRDGKQIFLSEDEARDECGKEFVRKHGKMSKSLRNYRSPSEIFDVYGADALRWYFFANQPPWTSILYSERSIKESIPEFLLRLWNVYSFFVIYANIDKFDPAATLSGNVGQLTPEVLSGADDYRPVADRAELDRWVLSELHATTATVTERMDAYDNYGACARLSEFADALSNWYVRRSRNRFWSNGQSQDKTDAYWTLYECLLTTCKLIGPFIPFMAEQIWQNLAVATFGEGATESVHLCDYPTADEKLIDTTLSEQMALVREIVSLGRSARMGVQLKVRQPLASVEVILVDAKHQAWLEEHAGLIREELNVKQVDFTQKADQYITYTVLPDLKRLGPRLGKRMPVVRKALLGADGGALLAEMESNGKIVLELGDGPVELDSDDVQVRLQAKEGWAAAQGASSVVVLATELTDDLIREGLARELVRAIQDRRKEMDCQYTDRIVVGLVTESSELTAAIEQFADYIKGETLAEKLLHEKVEGAEPVELKLAGFEATLYVKVV
jgi:isoleucyl-tRNA synthetase